MLIRAIMTSTFTKMKNTKINTSRKLKILQSVGVLASLTIFAIGTLAAPLAMADQFDEQIKALNQDSSQKRVAQSQLGAEASSLNDEINRLQGQIDAVQGRINDLNGQIASLKKQITDAETELAKQKAVLGQTIKATYVDGDVSTIEMLASSKDLSDFFDKQQYRESVRTKIKNTVDRITTLKVQLKSNKETVEKALGEQQNLQGQIVSQRSEKDRILGLNESQQNALNAQIKNNSAKASELRRQQAIENSKHGSGVSSGDPSKGGYPAKWANAPQDSLLDNWGMYNRECVSYTAWKVFESGRFMPYWGGRGNANQWPDNTSNKSKTPAVGTVAIAYWGYYGHAMYVEAVSGSRVYVSQYNYGVRGEYSEMWINTSEIAWFLSF